MDKIINKVFGCKSTKSLFIISIGLWVLTCAGASIIPASGATTVQNIPENFTSLAEKISPAVVNIRTVQTIKGGSPVYRYFNRGPFGNKNRDPMQDFFNRFFGEERQREFKHRSLGSGFFIDRNGFIVTNNHVIENADTIEVILKSGKKFEAEIIGRDPNTDIAIIKIKAADDFPAVTLGNSDNLKIGEWVVAIGSPFGLEQTVTAGIVSAKGRVIGSGPYDDFIQTDASINPGNSGGPLINMQGKVVGINTAIISGGQGIGFAIPINLAKGIFKQLRAHGEVTRGWLGVVIQDLSEELAEYYGIPDKKGVIITETVPGDPADEAGIKAEDILLKVNNEKVETSRDLTKMIAGISVGKKIKILVLRKGEKKEFTVKIAKRPDTKNISKNMRKKEDDELGINVSELTAEQARRLGVPNTEFVIITSVVPGGKGDRAGLKEWDIIKEINHHSIKTKQDYKKVIKSIGTGETISFFIRRMNAGLLVINLKK